MIYSCQHSTFPINSLDRSPCPSSLQNQHLGLLRALRCKEATTTSTWRRPKSCNNVTHGRILDDFSYLEIWEIEKDWKKKRELHLKNASFGELLRSYALIQGIA